MSEVNAERKRLKLRWAAACGQCGAELPPRTLAVYERTTKAVTCLACVGDAAASVDEPTPDVAVDPGVAGESARREMARRRAKRERRIRNRHPRLGGLILAITDEPQSTTAWGVGATGEEMLGAGLDRLAENGVLTLHDRRIPGTKTNIDHIAVAPSGVYVIDAKRYRGRRPRLQVDGGLFRLRTERLLVGNRDGTKLVAGVRKQVEDVARALEHRRAGRAVPPVTGVLCFVEADWPLIGGSFSVQDVYVEWPKKTYARLTAQGNMDPADVRLWHTELACAFPCA